MVGDGNGEQNQSNQPPVEGGADKSLGSGHPNPRVAIAPSDGRLKTNRERKAQTEQMSLKRHAALVDEYAGRGWRATWLKWLRELVRDRGYEVGLNAAQLSQKIIDSLDSVTPGTTDWQALHDGATARIIELEDSVLELKAQLERAANKGSATGTTDSGSGTTRRDVERAATQSASNQPRPATLASGSGAAADAGAGAMEKIDPWYLGQADQMLAQAHQSPEHQAQFDSSVLEVEPDTLTASVGTLFSLKMLADEVWCNYQGFRVEEDGDDALRLTLFV